MLLWGAVGLQWAPVGLHWGCTGPQWGCSRAALDPSGAAAELQRGCRGPAGAARHAGGALGVARNRDQGLRAARGWLGCQGL